MKMARIAALLVALSPLTAGAQGAGWISDYHPAEIFVAPQEYTIDMSTVDALWDLSGTYSEDLDDMTMNFTLAMDPSGKFTGDGYVTVNGFQGYDIHMNMGLTISGTVKASGDTIRVAMKMAMNGTGSVQGTPFTMDGSVSEDLELSTTSRLLSGTASGKVTVAVPSQKRKASAKIPKLPMQTTLPADVDGDWNLTMTPTLNGAKYTGTGSIELSNGKSLPLTLTGSYASKTDLSKLTLKGGGASLKLSVIFDGASVAVKTLSGKALGQSLKK